MTAQEIADRLVLSPEGVTVNRVKKSLALCDRSKVPHAEFLAALPYAVRVQLEQAP